MRNYPKLTNNLRNRLLPAKQHGFKVCQRTRNLIWSHRNMRRRVDVLRVDQVENLVRLRNQIP